MQTIQRHTYTTQIKTHVRHTYTQIKTHVDYTKTHVYYTNKDTRILK